MAKRGNPYHDAKGLFTSGPGGGGGKQPMTQAEADARQRAVTGRDGMSAVERDRQQRLAQKAAKALKQQQQQKLNKNEQAKALAAKFENKPKFVHPDMNKPASTTSGRFHITRNGVMIDLKNPAAGIESNLRMELGQRGMTKRR